MRIYFREIISTLSFSLSSLIDLFVFVSWFCLYLFIPTVRKIESGNHFSLFWYIHFSNNYPCNYWLNSISIWKLACIGFQYGRIRSCYFAFGWCCQFSMGQPIFMRTLWGSTWSLEWIWRAQTIQRVRRRSSKWWASTQGSPSNASSINMEMMLSKESSKRYVQTLIAIIIKELISTDLFLRKIKFTNESVIKYAGWKRS